MLTAVNLTIQDQLETGLSNPVRDNLVDYAEVGKPTHCRWHHSLAVLLACRNGKRDEQKHKFRLPFPNCDETGCFKLLSPQPPYPTMMNCELKETLSSLNCFSQDFIIVTGKAKSVMSFDKGQRKMGERISGIITHDLCFIPIG